MRGLALVPAALVAAACAGPPPRPPLPAPTVTWVELARFEVRDSQVDRFEHCPPPGDLGQQWLPPLPPWTPPASVSGSDPAASDAPPAGDLQAAPEPASLAALTSAAIASTRTAFRRCYHVGLMSDPTQDGHVGVVLRVDGRGHVASVETWGACDLAADSIVCMRDEAAHLRLPPPAAGSASVLIPVVFTGDSRRQPEPNDGYGAGAYVAVEAMRPRLHECLAASRRTGTGVEARAVFTIDVDGAGKGVHVGVDQWSGSRALLACAAEVLRDASFAKPPLPSARVVAPIVFNPRPGTG